MTRPFVLRRKPRSRATCPTRSHAHWRRSPIARKRCCVSGTGWGEFYIRNVVAKDICARVEYQGTPLSQAADAVVLVKLPKQEKDTGGVIAMDHDGHIAMPFNTSGMYRGWIGAEGTATTAIFRDQ